MVVLPKSHRGFYDEFAKRNLGCHRHRHGDSTDMKWWCSRLNQDSVKVWMREKNGALSKNHSDLAEQRWEVKQQNRHLGKQTHVTTSTDAWHTRV